MNIRLSTIVSCAVVFMSSPLLAYAQVDYLIASTTPFIKKSADLGSYLENVFRLGLGIALTLAIFMLVVNGIRYMASDIIGEKTQARQGMLDAVIGLVIIFGSFLILYTINPRLAEFHLQETIDRTVRAIQEGRPANLDPVPPSGGQGGGGDRGGCADCAPIPASVRCNNTPTKCTVASSLIPKIRALDNNLDGKLDWYITAGYAATGHARGSCHESGSCFDASFNDVRSPQNINAFISGARSVGLHAVYEVGSDTIRDAVIAAGVPAEHVQVNESTNYTGPHFHVTGG